jgi:sugar phosphate permease
VKLLDGFFATTGHTWQYAFWLPSAGLAAIGILFLWGQRNSPESAGLASAEKQGKRAGDSGKGNSLAVIREVLGNRFIWTLGSSYFCVKLVRYAFMFWLSTYLVKELGFRPDKAGYMNMVLPLAGFLGAVTAGYASDKLFGSRRAPINVIMMLGIAGAVYFYSRVSADPALGPVALALIGFMTFGPDTLISGTAAIDFGSRRGASTAAGFVNGMGSVGAAVQGLLVGFVASKWGWHAVFMFLICLALLAAAIQSTMWNARGKN